MSNCPWTIPFTVSRVVSGRGHDPVVPLQLAEAQPEVMEFTLMLGKKKLFEVFTQIQRSWSQRLVQWQADGFLTSPVTRRSYTLSRPFSLGADGQTPVLVGTR